MSQFHTPVLLGEAVEALHVRPGGKYIDGTIGGGGHTDAILRKGGHVLGMDVDTRALDYCSELFHLEREKEPVADPFFAKYAMGDHVTLVKANYRLIARAAAQFGFSDADGVLFDLGVSSHQLEQPEYGMSLKSEAPLDMRMDTSLAVNAATMVNRFPEQVLADLFIEYGEEKDARKIAAAIIRARDISEITTTTKLAGIVEKAVPRSGRIHPATRIFQALRIAVNSELAALEEGLQNSIPVLKKGGVLAVISFHSLEDRIVKTVIRQSSFLQTVTLKPIVPGEDEVTRNVRSRSAKLRVAKKI